MDEDNCSDKGSLNKCNKSLREESLDQDHGEGPPLGKERSSKQREGEAIGRPRGCEKVRSVDSGHPQPSKPVCIHLQVMIWGLMVSSCTHRRWVPSSLAAPPVRNGVARLLPTGTIILIFSVVALTLNPQDRAGLHLPKITASAL